MLQLRPDLFRQGLVLAGRLQECRIFILALRGEELCFQFVCKVYPIASSLFHQCGYEIEGLRLGLRVYDGFEALQLGCDLRGEFIRCVGV